VVERNMQAARLARAPAAEPLAQSSEPLNSHLSTRTQPAMHTPARVSSPFLAAVLLVVGACGGDAPQEGGEDDGTSRFVGACNEQAVIGGDRVGPLRVGAPMRRLPTSCAARDTTFSLRAGTPGSGFVVDMGSVPVVAITTGTTDSTVHRIIVTKPGLKTAAGIGIGSTMAELRQKYGRLCGEFGGSGLIGIRADSVPGVVFAMSGSADSLRPVQQLLERDASPVSDAAQVVSMWLVGADTRCVSP
jgi:hypothetical protein